MDRIALRCLLALTSVGHFAIAIPLHGASCAVGDVSVRAVEDRSVRYVCDALQVVLAWLATCNIYQSHPFSVEVVRELPPDQEHHYLGFYDRRNERVVVLEFDRCVTKTGPVGWFGMAMSPSLYRSLLVHEITHAVVEQNRHPARLRRGVHEYVAYVVQFATMDQPLREQILARFPHQPPIKDNELSELYLDLSPADFAVKAYAHFGMPAKGCPYLQALLLGTESLPRGWE